MSDRTGYACGTLSPIFYLERSDGYVILPVYDAGCPEQAKRVYEERYKNHRTEKWEWKATDGTLSAVDALQKRLEAQELRRDSGMLASHTMMREQVRSHVASNLRQRMCSSSTTPYEREFIELYLRLREDPLRDKYRQSLEHREYFLWARELDSGTKVEDRAPLQPGEFWRTPEQQKD